MDRAPWDLDDYLELARRACFVCEVVRDNPEYPHHVVHRTDEHLVFLSRFPVLWGHLLVVPTGHREHVVDDFTEDEYVRLHRLVHRVGRALTSVVPTERLYVLSFGSAQANRHVHWHVAPLPPGVPYPDQQAGAFAADKGFLRASEEELADLAAELRSALRNPGAAATPRPGRGA
ncbi:HIT family protein [Actinosynnema sp. NPDC020468]|uniref:HIT family protein n=1 Tax=Actinosynnema sp. NPDC020468 TaxID=3154488 RepID=UPI0033C586C7